MPPLKVALADDHALVRAGLRALFTPETEIAVVAEAGNGLQVADMIAQHAPDALLLDLMMPGLHGLEVLRQVQKRSPHVRIIVLSMHSDKAYVEEALRNGAVGYVLKNADKDELVTALHSACKHAPYLSFYLRKPALAALTPLDLPSLPDPYEAVSPREREVLQLSAEGFSHKAIAAQLSISPRTAEVHRMRLCFKLGISNHTELVKYALRRGLVSLDAPMPFRAE